VSLCRLDSESLVIAAVPQGGGANSVFNDYDV